MQGNRIVVWAWSAASSLTYGEAANQTAQFMTGLAGIHPHFKSWEGLDLAAGELFPIAENFADLPERLAQMARPQEDAVDCYSYLSANGDVTAETQSTEQFSFMLYSGGAFGVPSSAMTEAEAIEVLLHLGGQQRGSIQVVIPCSHGSAVSFDTVRAVLELTIRVWTPVCAGARVKDLADTLRDRQQQSLLKAQWMTYLRHPYIPSIVPTDLPCKSEMLSEEEVLFTLDREVPNPANPVHMDKAIQLQRLFDIFHFDHEYLLFGWPSDAADEEYCRQVTGAPADRVYVVGFAEFSGYDAQRKVLLYARMFREMNHDGGINIHPGVRENPLQLGRVPVVALARQHVSATDYVGASDTPIEWHIGIQSHAHAVATLVNEIAGIPVSRLRVIFTPFMGNLPD